MFREELDTPLEKSKARYSRQIVSEHDVNALGAADAGEGRGYDKPQTGVMRLGLDVREGCGLEVIDSLFDKKCSALQENCRRDRPKVGKFETGMKNPCRVDLLLTVRVDFDNCDAMLAIPDILTIASELGDAFQVKKFGGATYICALRADNVGMLPFVRKERKPTQCIVVRLIDRIPWLTIEYRAMQDGRDPALGEPSSNFLLCRVERKIGVAQRLADDGFRKAGNGDTNAHI